MNLKKSVTVARAINDMTQKDVAEKMEVSPQYLSLVLNRGDCTTCLLCEMAGAFNLKVSEFIALGE